MFGIHLVYAWYTKMTKKLTMTEHVWSDFNDLGICAVYKNRTGTWTGKRLFLLYQRYVQYQRLQETTIFDWYISFIPLIAVCVYWPFFAVPLLPGIIAYQKYVIMSDFLRMILHFVSKIITPLSEMKQRLSPT